MKTISIIGSAGRKEDGHFVSRELWFTMLDICCRRIKEIIGSDTEVTLRSGGAALSDHLAVAIFNNSKLLTGIKVHLELELPCEFINGKYNDKDSTGSTANYYHTKFAGKLSKDNLGSLKGIKKALNSNDCTFTVSEGFKERNLLVGKDCDYLLAYTFNKGKEPAVGSGTYHCWINSNCKNKEHYSI